MKKTQQQALKQLRQTGRDYLEMALEAELSHYYRLQHSELTKRGIAAAKKRKQCNR